MINDVEASFHVPVGLLYVFFGKISFRSSEHFLFGLLVFFFLFAVKLYELFKYFVY